MRRDYLDAHIRRRIERLELATRYRPIHIQTLFLALAPPEAMEDFFYSVAPPAADPSNGAKRWLAQVMAEAGIGGDFSGRCGGAGGVSAAEFLFGLRIGVCRWSRLIRSAGRGRMP